MRILVNNLLHPFMILIPAAVEDLFFSEKF